jgi:hypothetical protein
MVRVVALKVNRRSFKGELTDSELKNSRIADRLAAASLLEFSTSWVLEFLPSTESFSMSAH